MSPKYIYDDKQVRFRKDRTIKGMLLRGLKYLLVSLALAGLYYGIFSLLFSTDTERRLRQENRMYEKITRPCSIHGRLMWKDCLRWIFLQVKIL